MRQTNLHSQQPTWRSVIAGTLEYLSVLLCFQLLFDLIPLERWARQAAADSWVVRFVSTLKTREAIKFPHALRLAVARVLPEYDPDLRAWPMHANESEIGFWGYSHKQQLLERMIAENRWLDGYEMFWTLRRPAARRRVLLPLYAVLDGKHHPLRATFGVFAWSALLHGLWYPYFIIYALLLPFGWAWQAFLGVIAGYLLLSLPVVYNKFRRMQHRP